MMKQLFIIAISIIMFSCSKLPASGNSGGDGLRIKAKVIRITCASTTIDILDAAHYNLGESWTIEGTTNTYNHAAVVANKCELPSTLKEGDTFYFKVINQSEANTDCIVCMMYDYPPSKSIYLKVVN